jgi:hypothetical protein
VVNSTGFGVRGLGVRESGLDQDPYQKKIHFYKHISSSFEKLSARIVMGSESMVTCTSGLLPNPAKVPYFKYKA